MKVIDRVYTQINLGLDAYEVKNNKKRFTLNQQ